MDFDNKFPEWENEGVEPNESRRKTGFEAGFKPPASLFNWFWSKVIKAITELQTKFSGLSTAIDKIGTATSEDGATYTATIEGVTELYNGLKITIIPTMSNTNISPRLDINGLGDKAIRIAHSFNYAATNALKTNFLQEGRPVELKYDANCNLGVQGQGAWIFTDRVKTSAQDLYGTVPIESGGTGATDAETARTNLGAASSGYGYGEQMAEVTSSAEETYEAYCAKIDAILDGMANRETKQINATPPYSEDATFGACAVTLYKGTNAYASLVTIGHSNKYAYGWRMQKRGGVWEAFEWIDPPMNIDVVYRTIERYKGNAVYKKLGSDNILYWSTDNLNWKPVAAPAPIISQTDITAGTTELATGQSYHVYK